MHSSTRYIIILFIMAQAFVLSAIPGIKHIGTPLMRHYNRTDFNAGRQTWMIEQGPHGMMYFANNDGLLEFDGKYWNVYPLPNRTILRCIRFDGQDRIYAGGFNEIGYYAYGPVGRLTYHTLTGLIPEKYKEFGEAWRIHLTPFGVVFQSFSDLFIFHDDTVEIISAPGEFHFSYYVNGELFIIDRQEGVMRYAMGKLFPVLGLEPLRGKEIWGMQALDEGILLATAGDGIWMYDGGRLERWTNELSERLAKDKVFCTALINGTSIAFGTIQNGLVITDIHGNLLQEINHTQGLQDNTVLSMCTDTYGNLWLGLDNGIDCVILNSPLSTLSYPQGLSSGYAAVIHNGFLYLGTNRGLYASNWINGRSPERWKGQFGMVSNTSGQVWALKVIDGQLFCGHNNGTYLVDGDNARSISNVPGEWNYLRINDGTGKVIAGSYTGFLLFEKVNNQWAMTHRIRGFNESSRDFIMDDDNVLWVGHGFKGIFKVELNKELDSAVRVDFFDSSNGLPSDYGMTLFEFNDSIYINTTDGIYHIDEDSGKFCPSAFMRNILGEHFYRKITVDLQGNIWYFTDARAGVFRLQEDGSYLDITLPFEPVSNSFVGGFQFVYPYDEYNVLFGTENGFVHYDPSFYKDYKRTIQGYIRRVVTTSSDSVIYQGVISGSFRLDEGIAFKDNSLQFFFSANDFENPDRIEYSTYLSGQEDSWSAWSRQASREFTNLHEGVYSFQVKARNIYLAESAPVKVSFSISPPWRRSMTAYMLYALLVLIAVILVFFFIRRKISLSRKQAELAKERQFRQREEELRRASLESEKEVIRLKNEKLKEEMLLKDKELANSTLMMIQKNKLLVNLKDELKKLGGMSPDTEVRSQLRMLNRKINREIDTESQWKVFENHFEKVHEEFLQRLKAQFPELTPRELKLCAYLRLNISSKEIALLMNISTRGVEISRYRLRKKLNLDRETNLTDFIISF